MPTLADLNRQKRDYAFSGQANIGDVPWLYELLQRQAEANRPAGIGEPTALGAGEAAPNPQSYAIGGGGGGGGTVGAADTGLPGPGQTGFGSDFDRAFRDWERGGQAGEIDRTGEGAPVGPLGYIDLSGPFGYVLDAVRFGLPSPLGLAGSVANLGIRMSNTEILEDQLQRYGLGGLSFGQQIGAALGLNRYGTGNVEDVLSIVDERLGENDPFAQAMRAGLGEPDLSFFDAVESGAMTGGGVAEGRSRSSYRDTSPGRRGARDPGRGADRDPQREGRDIRESGSF